MRHTYIYRITDERTQDTGKVRYIYAVNKRSAKRWQLENCTDYTAKIECVGEKKQALDVHAQELTPDEYNAIKDSIAKMTNPDFWKALMPASGHTKPAKL